MEDDRLTPRILISRRLKQEYFRRQKILCSIITAITVNDSFTVVKLTILLAYDVATYLRHIAVLLEKVVVR